MYRLILCAALIGFLTSLTGVVGCGGGDETVAPEKMEESRQKMIQRTERMRQDMQKKK